jgi:GNAT superfamily N-acetyltransferase
MATLPEVRGKGCGVRLLQACVETALERSVPLLWCNARETAVGFYSKQGWQILGARFEIPTVGPHFRMFLKRNAPVAST